MVSFGTMWGPGRGCPLLSGSPEAQLKSVQSWTCGLLQDSSKKKNRANFRLKRVYPKAKRKERPKKRPSLPGNSFYKKDRKLSKQQSSGARTMPLGSWGTIRVRRTGRLEVSQELGLHTIKSDPSRAPPTGHRLLPETTGPFEKTGLNSDSRLYCKAIARRK